MHPLSVLYPDMILDKRVIGGCSLRRPDGLLDCGSHSIIVEIDEDQHCSYDNVCDNRRTMELFVDLGSRPLVFIRLNPDGYKACGKRVKSAFPISKIGDMSVNVREFGYRLEALEACVLAATLVVPSRDLSYVKLFYTDD